MELFTKISNHGGKVFFASYVNSVGSKIDGSDLICAPSYHVHLICSLFPMPMIHGVLFILIFPTHVEWNSFPIYYS
jgi:hypothetical protein